MRLATPLYNMEAGAKSTVELRSNDEREHRGTEVDAPHRSWPPSSFLRDLKAHIAPVRLWRIYWCRNHEWLLIIGGMISRRGASPFAAAVGVSSEFEGPEPM